MRPIPTPIFFNCRGRRGSRLRLLGDEVGVADGGELVRPGLERLEARGLAAEARPKPVEELRVEPLPDIQRAEADAVLLFQDMGDALGGRTDQAERDVAADTERQSSESGKLAPRERVGGVLPVLALDRPKLAVPGFGDEINALVGVRELQPVADGGRHVGEPPHGAQLGGVLGIEEEIGPDQFLEQVTLLLVGQAGETLPEHVPVGAIPGGVSQQTARVG